MNVTADFVVQPASKMDASVLAELIVIAGDGLPLHIWDKMRKDEEDVMAFGAARAAREEGGFSYRNADVIRINDKIASAVVAYPLLERTALEDIKNAPLMFQPLLELENLVTPSFYINALSTIPEARGLGAATQLLMRAEQKARRANLNQLSLITGDINPARGLYERFGFRAIAQKSIHKENWHYDGQAWVLYVKNVH